MGFSGLVIDIDGTLLRQGKEKIDDQDLAALRMLIQRNIPVVVVTGRTRFRTEPVLKQLGVTQPAIVLLGTQVIDPNTGDNEEVLPMDQADVNVLLDWAKNRHIISSLVTPRGTLLSDRSVPLCLEDLWPFLAPDESASQGTAAPILQVVLPVADSALRQNFLQLIEQEDFNILLYIQEDRIICFNAEADKGPALHRLAARRGWDLSRFVALGNDTTDVSVFEEVKRGIAVGGRDSDLVALAYTVVESTRPHLIAECIDRYFL